jgi:hypothetical protein
VPYVIAYNDNIQLKIGKEIYYGSVNQKYETMALFRESNDFTQSVNTQRPIDETDLMIIEQDSLRSWQKQFTKLK